MFVVRQGHALHDRRRPQGARRHRRPVVRQCRPLPAEDHRGDRSSRPPSSTTRRPSRWATRRRSSWPTGWSTSRPKGMDHVFFTNSGSESVETALKIALAYHRVKGEGSRTRLIGRERGYHGVNFGGISVGGIVTNRKMFGTLLDRRRPHAATRIDPARTPSPRGEPEHGARARRRAGAHRRAARRLDHRRRHRRAGRRLDRRAHPAEGLSAERCARSATSTASC